MGMYYRKDLFAKYGLSVPKTWDRIWLEHSHPAQKDPNLYITNFSSAGGDFAQWAAYMWQAGGNWFSTDGNNWKVTINSAINKKVMGYWGKLASQVLLLNAGNLAASPVQGLEHRTTCYLALRRVGRQHHPLQRRTDLRQMGHCPTAAVECRQVRHQRLGRLRQTW